jgi:hypothetical protein
LAPQIGKGAVKHFLLVRVAAFKLNGLNGVEVAPPGVGIASPLRMQCPHPGEAAPQWYTRSDKAAAKTVEQLSCGDAAQSLAYRPDVQFDDLPPERGVSLVARCHVQPAGFSSTCVEIAGGSVSDLRRYVGPA